MWKRVLFLLLSALLVLSLAACGKKDTTAGSGTSQPVTGNSETEASTTDPLTVRFGSNGAPFMMELENNPVLEGWGNKLVIISPGE